MIFSNLFQNPLLSLPLFVAAFAVGFRGVGFFAQAHEAVAGSFVRDGHMGLAGLFHQPILAGIVAPIRASWPP